MTGPALYTRDTLKFIRDAARRDASAVNVARQLGWGIDRLRRLARAHGIAFPLEEMPTPVSLPAMSTPAESVAKRDEGYRRKGPTLNSATLPSGERLSTVTLRVAETMDARLRDLALAEGISLAEWLRRLIAAELARRDGDKTP